MSPEQLSPEQDLQLGLDTTTAADQPSPPAEKVPKEFDIEIYRDWCKCCGICASFCPKQCLTLDEEGSPVVSRPERCTGCGWCELHCPDFTISVRPKNVKPSQD
jgi:2-oxoglutarate ferredoxin oxidoreductase subunit delta